ncbi:MAG: flotillin family protein, partial [Planctomycetota bacterium]
FVYNSEVATDVKNTFFNGNPEYFRDKLQQLVGQFDLSTDDIKDLSIAALIAKMLGLAGNDESRSQLQWLQQAAANIGLADKKAATLQLEAVSDRSQAT